MKKPVVIGLVFVGVVILVVGGAVAFWALTDSADDEFELSATETTEAADTRPTTTSVGASTTWIIADGSEAGYRIDEELQGLAKTTTGRTEDVGGELTLGADGASTATFTLDEPIGLGAKPRVDEPVSVEANGTLELHGVTKDVTVKIDAQLTAEDAMEVVGSTPIALADYDIEVPDISGIVTAAPEGTLEFKLALTPA